MASPTPNKGYTYPVHGGAVNAWDTPLDTNFDYIDLNVGGPYPLTITSTTGAITYNSSYASVGSAAATITPPSSLAQNLYYKYTGTMTNDQDIAFPASGGIYVINNGSSGAYSLRATVSGSTSVNALIAQGGTNIVVTNGVDMVLANSNSVAKIQSYLGNPNGNVAGNVATANGGVTDFEWDVTDKILYAATTTGTAATAVWTPVSAKMPSQGILTPSNSTLSPIQTSDITATTIYYTPYNGNWTPLTDGTTIYPYQFSQMSLSLTAGVHAASNIYDVFMYWNAGTPIIGTGPSWLAGTSGSITAGACARGTGVGGTALTRLLGVLVNAAAVTLSNGVSTYACPANQGIYLGSIFIDTSAGQVTCNRGYGQSRKWGVWSFNNRTPILLKVGDSTITWTYGAASYRPSNNNTANSLTTFCGLAEEEILATFYQNSDGNAYYTGIGWNTTSTPSGFIGRTPTKGGITTQVACYQAPPALGINVATCLENEIGGGTATVYGTESNILLTAQWNG